MSGDAVELLETEALAALQRYLGLPDRQPPADQPLWLDDERRPMTAPGVVRLLRRLGAVAERSERKRAKGDITVTITITISRGRR